MACEPDVMDQEFMFHSILGEATGMQTDTAFLTVSTDDGRALIFEPAGE
jgi:heat shock protein HslJ